MWQQPGKENKSEMKTRVTAIGVLTIAILVALLCSCTAEKKQEQTQGQPEGTTSGVTASSTESGSAAGVTWKVPAGWTKGGERPMRAATYNVGTGDAQAECAVFFFGAGQGGDIESNISRWITQVTQPDGSDSQSKAVKGEVKSPCCQITTVDITGTYMSSSGPMMQTMAEKPDYELLGGIVTAPEGNVFFKLTGPKATVDKIRAAFLGMLSSVDKAAS